MELKHLIREAISESLYEANIIMRYARDENLTLINDKLRGICGITIVDVFIPTKIVSKHVDLVTLKIKFFLGRHDLQQHMHKMSNEARKIEGVYSFIPTRASKLKTKSHK
jgi:ferredoxin-fold anticodon binding domain-containing protein